MKKIIVFVLILSMSLPLSACGKSKSDKVSTIAITDAEGTKTAAINDDADSAGATDAVPDYWQTALDEGVDAINTALCEAGQNKSTFLFYSDAHWNYGSQMSPALLKYLYNHTDMEKTFFGGDIVNDETADMSYLWEWRKQLQDLPNHHSVVGNHDDGNTTNNLFPEEYIYNYLLAPEETPDMAAGDTGLYYYIDNPAEMTRYLCLDTAYQGVTDEQTAFITETLKSTPANWHIVVIAHIWYVPDYDQYDVRPIPITGLDSGASAVAAILDRYNARKGEFADCGAKVEFCIGGHVHRDYTGTTDGGIPIIVVETDSQHIRSGLTYTAGTTTEASVNGIIANYNDHILNVVRVGRGNSFSVNLASGETTEIPDNGNDDNSGGDETTTYTNILSLALADDGVSIYNADDTPGYKANTRWSHRNQVEQEKDGRYITGWIPVAVGDVIRLENIVAQSELFTVFVADTPGSTAGSVGFEDLTTSWGGAADESGNIIQFMMSTGDPYIRIYCGGIDNTSIITINQEID